MTIRTIVMTSLEELRQFTVARNFPKPTTLNRALLKMGFVQADPIRSPARAQDLILRHRVKTYRAGELESRYADLDVEEDFFVNYGYVTTPLHRLMHPRSNSRVPADDIGRAWPASQRRKAKLLFDFVDSRGPVHPRDVDAHFAHGKVTNYWGGSSNATTHLLDAMHYTGMLRVVKREKGIRIYATNRHSSDVIQKIERQRRIDLLVDVLVNIYAPLSASSLAFYVRRLRFAVPQWRSEMSAALQRAKLRLATDRIEGVDWYWPSSESRKAAEQAAPVVRLLAPFDPVVHDRARFETLNGWSYRFEAYTPVAKRKLGYYAMPLLWRDRVIGWANLSVKNGKLDAGLGYVDSEPRDREFRHALEVELEQMKLFLGIDN